MTSVRIEALDPTDPRSQAAVTQFLNEMVERVGADVLEIDVAQEAREDSGKNFFVVALDDRDNVVGCGSLRQVELKVGQIHRLWVNQVLRGRSIGRRMLSALEGAGAVAGFEFIRLEVYEALTEAVLLFETSGYTQVEPWEVSPPDLKAYQKQLVPVTEEPVEES
jgi:ribosomal protein S18 acetylase RimI-like enzyme